MAFLLCESKRELNLFNLASSISPTKAKIARWTLASESKSMYPTNKERYCYVQFSSKLNNLVVPNVIWKLSWNIPCQLLSSSAEAKITIVSFWKWTLWSPSLPSLKAFPATNHNKQSVWRKSNTENHLNNVKYNELYLSITFYVLKIFVIWISRIICV